MISLEVKKKKNECMTVCATINRNVEDKLSKCRTFLETFSSSDFA